MGTKRTLDWNEYIETARRAIAEGCVLLENRNQLLPLAEGTKVSVFGRIQEHYYKSGTGSGGMVNVASVYSVIDGILENRNLVLDEELRRIYKDWETLHPYYEGIGWGAEPWSQEEMELTDQVAKEAAERSEVAIVIIGRTAGEDRDLSDTPGSYQLTETEVDMLCKVRKYFSKMIVLLNVGGIIDMSWMDEAFPDALMYIWQGGMIGGLAVADVLTGRQVPSGKLTDTIALSIKDYPSNDNFGHDDYDCYAEDIYVGYRYFETFAKEKVRYPFGYGLTYTEFELHHIHSEHDDVARRTTITMDVKNVGAHSGREVLQFYGEAPQGVLGKPLRSLLTFVKTEELAPGENETVVITIDDDQWASYDDGGATGYKSCFVLEAGTYKLYAGTNVRNAQEILEYELPELVIVEKLYEALAPVRAFERIHPVIADGVVTVVKEPVPLATILPEDRRLMDIPEELPTKAVSDDYVTLADVVHGRASLQDVVAQLTDEDLACIVRGEGMGSSLVTPGTAAAFGGVSPRLRSFGIPAMCCDDGPSGMRLDSGVKAFSLPNGTMLGCSFNPDLVEALYSYLGLEMISNKVDALLGPGMNIHRHPLNGRNFEYFSEDPYVTGVMGTAQVRGIQSVGVTGTIKHFAANNQEYQRRSIDSTVSERALREIYLKGFEMVVRSGVADSIMTTYGSLNGLFTAGQYDLNTTILRKQWGYTGIVMTDWWADINERNKPKDKTNFAAMIASQNDIYMVCPDGKRNASGDNTLEALADGRLKRSELQRCALNICQFALHTEALRRMMGERTEVEIINRPVYADDFDAEEVDFILCGEELTVDLTYQKSVAETNYLLPLETTKLGIYEVTLIGSSELGELAQIPCTLFFTGIPVASFTFHGTNGENMEITQNIRCASRFATLRLQVGRNGVDLKEIRFRFKEKPADPIYDYENEASED